MWLAWVSTPRWGAPVVLIHGYPLSGREWDKQVPALPFLLQTDNNPESLPGSLFEGFIQAAKADSPAWMKGFLDNSYNMDGVY